MTQKSTSFNDFVIVLQLFSCYRIYFCLMSKDETVSRMGNSDLTEKKKNGTSSITKITRKDYEKGL